MTAAIHCAGKGCWGVAVGGKLCRRCCAVREAVLIVGLCLGGSALIVVGVKVFG